MESETRQGAPCSYRKPNKLGVIGTGKGSGTINAPVLMAGRKMTSTMSDVSGAVQPKSRK